MESYIYYGLNILKGILPFFAVVLWVYSLVAIWKSSLIKLYKIGLTMLIVSAPPIGFIYPLRHILIWLFKPDLKGARKRLSLFSRFGSWLLK